MKIRVLSIAEQEFAETVDYYNGESPGLGYEFAAEVAATFNRIREHPNAWAAYSRQTRRCQLHRFPYGVLYQVREDCILVVAVMHLHRNPRRWRERIRKSGLR